MKRITFSVILLTLSIIACGMPVSTVSEKSVNKANLINTPTLSPAPTPPLAESQTVCGFWNIRSAADPNSVSIGIVMDGGTVYLTGQRATSEDDGGSWVQVRGRDKTGWMNAKGLCK